MYKVPPMHAIKMQDYVDPINGRGYTVIRATSGSFYGNSPYIPRLQRWNTFYSRGSSYFAELMQVMVF